MRVLFFTLFNLFVSTVLSSQIAENALIQVEKDGRTGWIDHNGQVIVPLKYDRTREFSEEIVAVNQGATLDDFGYEGGKWGYCNRKGVEIIPPQFDEVADFKQGLAAVKKGKKYGYVNAQGKIQIPLRYDYATDFSEGLAAVELKGQWGFINTQGQWAIPAIYDHASAFQHGLAIIFSENFRYPVEDDDEVFETQGKYGLIDRKGKLVLDTIYDELGPFINGYARISRDYKEGFVDSTGKIAIPLIYEKVTQFSEGLAAVAIRYEGPFPEQSVLDSLIRIAEHKLEEWRTKKEPPQMEAWLSSPLFAALSEAYQHRLALRIFSLNGQYILKYGYIDQRGKVVIPCQYELAMPFYQGIAHVSTHKTLSSMPYFDPHFFLNEGQFRLPTFEDMVGVGANLIDKTGRLLFPRPSAVALYYRDATIQRMGYDGDFFYQNGQKLATSNLGFERLNYLGAGLFAASTKNAKNSTGVYSAAGTKVLENDLIEAWLGLIAPNRLMVKGRLNPDQAVKFGIVDLQGKWIVEPIYDDMDLL